MDILVSDCSTYPEKLAVQVSSSFPFLSSFLFSGLCCVYLLYFFVSFLLGLHNWDCYCMISCSDPGRSKVVAPIVKFGNDAKLAQLSTVLVPPDKIQDFFHRHVYFFAVISTFDLDGELRCLSLTLSMRKIPLITFFHVHMYVYLYAYITLNWHLDGRSFCNFFTQLLVCIAGRWPLYSMLFVFIQPKNKKVVCLQL